MIDETCAVFVVTVSGTVLLFALVPKGLFPQQDTGSLAGFTETAQDTSFPAMREHQEAVLRVLAQEPSIRHYIAFIGGGGGGTLNTGSVFLDLKPR